MNGPIDKKITTKKIGDYWFVFISDEEIKSPLGKKLNIPTRRLANALLNDLIKSIQSKNSIDSKYLRLANNASDIIPTKREKIILSLADYIFTDTLCYRDKKNHSLFCLQENKWKPILDWFSQFTGINIIISEDLSPIKQSNILHKILVKWFKTFNNHQISALNALTSITGSCVLGISILMGNTNILKASSISLLEEEYSQKKRQLDREEIQRKASLHDSISNFSNYLYLAGNSNVLYKEFIKIKNS